MPTRPTSDRRTVLIAPPWSLAGSPIDLDLRDRFDVVFLGVDCPKILEVLSRPGAVALVVELRAPDFAGLGIVRTVKASLPTTKVVIVVADLPDDVAIEILDLCVEGLVVASPDVRALGDCIQDVCEGRICLDQGTMRRVVKTLAARLSALRDAMCLLTQREIEIVRLVCTGLTNKEIACRLFVAEGTIKVHLHKIFDKLQVRSRRALAAQAREKGLA